MRRVLFVPFAKFVEREFAFGGLFILPRPIIDPFADGALQFYKIFLRHNNYF